MNRELIKDLARKRKQYLWTKGTSYLLSAMGCLVAIPCLLVLLVLLLPIILGNPDLYYVLAGDADDSRDLMFSIEQWRVIQLVLLWALIILVVGGVRYCRYKFKQADTLPYIPPVAYQIAALPAEEILAHGSDQPSAAPDELLRAAHEGTGMAAQELLRPEPTAEPLQQVGDRTV